MNTLRGLTLASHPIPSVAVTGLGTIFGITIGLTAPTLAVLGVALLLGQVSVGWSNDWIDAHRDRRVARRSKPIAVDLVSVGAVRAAALGALTLAIITTAFLGWRSLLTHALALASAWLYNVYFKKTFLSWLPFAISFGLLPVIATLALSPPRWPTAWIITAAACLGVAAHFANVLPDFADDKKTGVWGLPHRIGATRSGVAAFTLLGLAGALIVLGFLATQAPDYNYFKSCAIGANLIIGLVTTTGIIVYGILLVLRGKFGKNLFHLIIAGALADAAMLALAGTPLLTP